jgi:hypothetical protein
MLRIMNSFGPQSLTALTKRNENKYQSSRSMANTILTLRCMLIDHKKNILSVRTEPL